MVNKQKESICTLHFWKKMLIYNWTVEISLDICTHVCRTRRNEIICHLWKCFHIHEKLLYFLSWPPPVVQPAHLLCSSKPLSGIKAELYPPSPPTSPLPKKQILFPISLCQRFLDLWDFLYHNLPITFMCNPHPQKLSFCKIALGHIPRWALLPLRRQDDVVVSLTIPPSNQSHAYLILVLIT